MSDFRELRWYERQEPTWRLEISMRWSRRKSILCEQLTKGRHFWGRIKVEDGFETPLQRCRLCRCVRFEPATIDIRGIPMTIETARRIGRSWLDQMDAIGKPVQRVRVYFRAVAGDGVESFMVWTREDEILKTREEA